MLSRNLSRLINSPFPFLIFGSGSLIIYLFLWSLSKGLLAGELDSLADRFLATYPTIKAYGYWLFFLLYFNLVLGSKTKSKGYH